MSDSYPGLYRAVCTQVSGTKIKVKVPQLLGEVVLSEWALACVPPGWGLGLLKGHGNHPGIYMGHHSHTVDVAATASSSAGDHSHEVDVGSTASTSANGPDPHTHSVDPASATSSTAGSHTHSTDPAPVTSSSNGGGTYYQANNQPYTHDHNHVQHQLAPKVGEGVWVMFEGGDVDHPVWMGVF